MFYIRTLSIYFLFLLPLFIEARVFNFQFENTAPYFRIGAGTSSLQKSAFVNSSGNYDLAGSSEQNHAVEFGWQAGRGQWAGGLGIEGLVSQSVEASASNSSGQKLYDLRSRLLAVSLRTSIWFYGSQKARSRSYLGVSLGGTQLYLENVYDLTAQGSSELGLGSFTEVGMESLLSGDVFMGYEIRFSDTATVSLDLGYRFLRGENLLHRNSINSFMGSVKEGDPVLNSDGSRRRLDLGGFYMACTFRFYL